MSVREHEVFDGGGEELHADLQRFGPQRASVRLIEGVPQPGAFAGEPEAGCVGHGKEEPRVGPARVRRKLLLVVALQAGGASPGRLARRETPAHAP